MSVSTLQILSLLLDPRVTGPPMRVMSTLRSRGVRRLPEQVYDMRSGRLRLGEARRLLAHWLDGERLTRHRGQWVLNSFLPPFPGTAYARLFESVLSGRNLSPVSAHLALTARCPLRCTHCSLGGRERGRELSTEEWSNVIGQLHSLGAGLFGLTGGEPCLRDDLPQIVQAVTGGGGEAVLYTSGSGFTPELAAKLADAGLWSVCVSLDHHSAQGHDARRGEGAFERALAAVRLAVSRGFYAMIGTLATPHAVESGEIQRIHGLGAELGVQEMRIVEPMPCGRLAGCPASELLSADQVAAVRRFHTETNRGRLGPKVCAFNQVESPEVFGCGAGTQHLFIDAIGNVCPCDFTPLAFGSVREGPILPIWECMNGAMGGGPRTHCFIQANHQRILAVGGKVLPLAPRESEAVCREAGPEPLPGFHRSVTSGRASVAAADTEDPTQSR